MTKITIKQAQIVKKRKKKSPQKRADINEQLEIVYVM